MGITHRHYVEKVANIEADKKSGIVKVTFAVDGKDGEVFQMIVPVGYLREMFAQIGEKMQSTFERGPGGPGGPQGGRRGPGNAKFEDLTE